MCCWYLEISSKKPLLLLFPFYSSLNLKYSPPHPQKGLIIVDRAWCDNIYNSSVACCCRAYKRRKKIGHAVKPFNISFWDCAGAVANLNVNLGYIIVQSSAILKNSDVLYSMLMRGGREASGNVAMYSLGLFGEYCRAHLWNSEFDKLYSASSGTKFYKVLRAVHRLKPKL